MSSVWSSLRHRPCQGQMQAGGTRFRGEA
jgi:hypothetical protein